MELNNGIVFNVTHVDLLSTFQDFWMLTQHQPANVSEEEATIGIMWISISFGIFMMDTMISYPIVNGVLCGENS